MSVTVVLRKDEINLDGPLPLKETLKKLGLSTQTHLALRDGELLTENDVLRDGETVKLVAVISGG